MYVDKLTASYVKDLLDTMKKFKILFVILAVEDDHHPVIKIGARPTEDGYMMASRTGGSDFTVGEVISDNNNKKKFIEKFKSSKMYLKRV
jgi:hypothetical protein